ncbi:MAG TPA: hypothetical protein VG476_09295 [Acidimicrobiales bacterium]|nr:hypothetical protein [Acidimicrobiales bacterium]
MCSADREDLLGQQAKALRALTVDGACPEQFDPRGHAATRETLVRKRVASLTRHWPALPRAMGGSYDALVREYVLTRPRLTSDSRADGRAFAAWLSDRGRLPDAAFVELMRFDVSFRVTAAGARRRRLPALRVRRHPRLRAVASVPRPGARLPLTVVFPTERLVRRLAWRRSPPAA